MCDNRLFGLIALGSSADIESSLSNGLSPDYKENDDLSALMIASCRKHINQDSFLIYSPSITGLGRREVIEILVRHGCDVDLGDEVPSSDFSTNAAE